MDNHFITNNLISNKQSGFRPNDSVTNQLICLMDAIDSSSESNLDVHSVFLDMIPLTKYGMQGCYLNLNKMELMVKFLTFLKVIWL